LKEVERIETDMDKMDDQTEEVSPNETTTMRIVANLGTESNESTRSSPILLLDPAVANTKGRPRHLTIREAIKANKFYKCSHYGSAIHTLKNCDKKHLVFNLPKPKKSRKSKKAVTGEFENKNKKIEINSKNYFVKRQKPT
jgi:hypothetical protein